MIGFCQLSSSLQVEILLCALYSCDSQHKMKKLVNKLFRNKTVNSETVPISSQVDHKKSCPSKVSTISFSHRWTISNVTRLWNETKEWKWDIISDSFSPPANPQWTFRLVLYPNDEHYPLHVGVGVGAVEMPQDWNGKVEGERKYSIENENGDECNVKSMSH